MVKACLQPRAYRLGLSVKVKDVFPHLASPTGLFVAAEGQGGVKNVVSVDPDGSGAQCGREPVRLRNVLRPDARRQAIHRAVGARH